MMFSKSTTPVRRLRRLGQTFLVVASAGVAACSGAIEAPGGGGSGASAGAGGPAGGGRGPGAGGAGVVPTGGAGGGAVAGTVDPGMMPLRRLSNVEYRNTVRDLLGASESDVNALELVPDVSGGLFASNADVQSLTSAHLDKYDKAARTLATQAMASAARRSALIRCDLAAERAACTRSFITAFGRRAYRRPLTTKEADEFVTLAGTETQANDGIALALRALLQSPHFLFRPEVGVPDPAKPGLNRLTSREIATRLSYLLWGTTPSETLAELADKDGLATADDVETLASTMLKDERAKPALRRFVSDWLRLTKLPSVELDKTRFPDWGDELKRSMAEETTQFVEGFLWAEKGSFMDYLDARHTFVDARIAKIYGLSAPAGAAWQRVSFANNAPRAGIVTQPSVLAVTGRENGTSAIWRGKFVREALLCEQLPAPPADVGEIKPPEKGVPERVRLEQHRAAPKCAGCHRRLDPLGFGLSGYDATGAYRTSDEFGNAIDDSGQLEGFDRPEFRGALELVARLKTSDAAAACVAEMLGQHLLGRGRTEADDVLMTDLQRAFSGSGFAARAVILAFVGSDAFRYRRP